MSLTSTNPSPNSFDKKKTAYCQMFAVEYLSAFRPHYLLGETLGKGVQRIEDGSKRSFEVWRNVAEHCLVAGVFAAILADELGLSIELRESVAKAAIVHDWYKKHESLALADARRNNTLSLHTLEQIKTSDAHMAAVLGIPTDIIELAGANLPKTSKGPETLPEKIIWYVDAMLSNTEPMSIDQRFDNLERGWDGIREDPVRAERNVAFSNLYRERYEGKSLYELQRELGEKIGQEFAQVMNYQGPVKDLPLFFKSKFEARVIHL